MRRGTGRGGSGPNGKNDHGLCTAYFNGQKNGHDKNGHDKNGQPGPFAALEETSRAYTDSDGVDNDGDGEIDEENENQDLSAAENIFNFCDDTTTIGGNPEHGRFTCSDDPETNGNDPPGPSSPVEVDLPNPAEYALAGSRCRTLGIASGHA